MKNITNLVIFLSIFCTFISCKKSWLEEKPDNSLAVPSTIEDLQALLDNASGNGGPGMNTSQNILDELANGDLYLTESKYNPRSELERNVYIWASDIYGSSANYTEWIYPYSRILNTNVVLESIGKIAENRSSENAWKQVKGSALFYRAYSFYDIAKLFCKPFDAKTAISDLGIPLRLGSNFNDKSTRSSVQETYDRIVKDLKEAEILLPVVKPDQKLYKFRPTKATANAMLARVYLSMSNYDSALKYSDKCLQLYNNLIDYNTIPINNNGAAFTAFNEEVIFHNEGNAWFSLFGFVFLVDHSLYNMYDDNDLRKSLFFNLKNGDIQFKGNYTGNSIVLFSGLTTDEMYLIKAESLARKGQITEAMVELNSLLQKRWTNSIPYSEITSTSQMDALNRILAERRKELCFRGLRWSDLRRLNLDPAFATSLTRVMNGKTYTLSPNDPKYVFPIPNTVIDLTGMAQNQR
jgi:hypothetical protein